MTRSALRECLPILGLALTMAFLPVDGCWAQNANVAVIQGAPPVVFANGGLTDPYATTAQASTFPWTTGLPTFQVPAGLQNRFWLRGEYLRWRTEGMQVPVLVATSTDGTPQNQAAILGQPGTTVLFGGGEINDDSVNGFRIRTGFWVTRDGAFGLEGEYFDLADQNDGYYGSSDGTVILGRPFFDITTGQEAAQLLGFPNLVRGDVRIRSDSDFKSALVAGRVALCPVHAAGCAGEANCDRVDWIVGFRHLRLDDQLTFNQNLESLLTGPAASASVGESFSTQNRFNGVQLGFVYVANFQRAWLESLLRVAVGNNEQTVTISGATTTVTNGTTADFSGGFLAQRTNSGTFRRDEFTMVPEFGLTLGVRITRRLHATVGYSLIYFPSVVRAGDQIDRDLNPNLFPPEANPFNGALRPAFGFVESDYFAHGLNVGGEFRF